MKKILLMALSLILVATVSVAGTLAYFSYSDEDINTMTIGNVKIEQIELERVEQTDSGNDALQPFTQNKKLVPAVYDKLDWARNASGGQVYQAWPEGGSSALFTVDVKNVIDKVVYVKNTGESDIYFRTVIAIEDIGNDNLIHLNVNTDFYTMESIGNIEIDGGKYLGYVFTYKGKGSTHANGILKAGEASRPSLLQLFLDKAATNEDVAVLGDTYDVYVVSQAVQADGFDNAADALDAAFGEISATKHPWAE